MDNTLLDYTFILNCELSFINPSHIQIYWMDKDADFLYCKDLLEDDTQERLNHDTTLDRDGSYVIVGQVIFIA